MPRRETLPTVACVALALATLVAGVVAAVAEGAAVAVAPRALDALHAERLDVTDALEVVSTSVERSLLALPAFGTPDAPAELTEAMTPARTQVAARSWTYTATIAESSAESAASGAWDVVLLANGRPLPAVRIEQNLSDPLVAEGARVTWDLGPEKPALRQFVVLAVPIAADGYRLRSEVDAFLVPHWTGVGGEIEGETNPTLDGAVGAEMTITIANGDANPHRIVVKDEDGATVAGPTETIDELNEEETLAWTPANAGAFTYVCDFHPDSMQGTIQIANEEATTWQRNSRS